MFNCTQYFLRGGLQPLLFNYGGSEVWGEMSEAAIVLGDILCFSLWSVCSCIFNAVKQKMFLYGVRQGGRFQRFFSDPLDSLMGTLPM